MTKAIVVVWLDDPQDPELLASIKGFKSWARITANDKREDFADALEALEQEEDWYNEDFSVCWRECEP